MWVIIWEIKKKRRKNEKLTFIIAILNILLLQIPLKAQDSVQVVVVSQRTGLYIEPAERDYYGLFSSDQYFVLAYFTKDSTDVYTGRIMFLNDKILQERKFKMKKISLQNLGERIDNYEKIKSGNYTMGTNPAGLKFVWVKRDDIKDRIKNINRVVADYPLLKEPDDDYAKFLIHYPRIGISLGIGYTNFKFDDLSNLTDAINKFYEDKGFVLFPAEPEYQLSPIIRFKGNLEITSHLSASLMVESDLSNPDVDYNAMTVMGYYDFKRLMENFVPYAGLGYTRNNFNIKVNYGMGTVDSLGGMLESVEQDGKTEGLVLEAGIKALLGNSFSIGIAADYYFLLPYKYTTNYLGFSSEIRPGNFGAGIYFNILF